MSDTPDLAFEWLKRLAPGATIKLGEESFEFRRVSVETEDYLGFVVKIIEGPHAGRFTPVKMPRGMPVPVWEKIS